MDRLCNALLAAAAVEAMASAMEAELVLAAWAVAEAATAAAAVETVTWAEAAMVAAVGRIQACRQCMIEGIACE